MSGIFVALKFGPRNDEIIRIPRPMPTLLFPIYDPVETRLFHSDEPMRSVGYEIATYTPQRWRLGRRETLYFIYSTSSAPLHRRHAVPLIRKIRMAAHTAGCAWWEKQKP